MRRRRLRTTTSRHDQSTIFPLAFCALLTVALAVSASASERLSFDHAATSDKIVALTFDADMTPGMLRELKSKRVASWYNEKVIATLRQEQVPATLFLAGLWIEVYSDATKELSADPLFELANHSYSHGAFHSPCYRLFPIPDTKQAAEVQKTDDLLKKYAVTYKKYFRFPGLCSDAKAAKMIADQGYTAIGADVDGGDAFEKNPKWITSVVTTHVRPGSIVVLLTPASVFVQSWDPGLKPGEANSRSACTTWLFHENNYYLVDVVAGQFDYPTLRERAISLARSYKPFAILIEDTLMGAPLITELKKAGLPAETVKQPSQDKAGRLFVHVPKFANGQVFFPKGKPWRSEVEAELFSFPGGRSTDIVDSTTQALTYDPNRFDAVKYFKALSNLHSALWFEQRFRGRVV